MNRAVAKYLKPVFDERFKRCVEIIKSYKLDYEEVGVFGSYARGDYKGTSDIDFCMVIDSQPDRRALACMRQDLEDIGAELMCITSETFKTGDRPIYCNIRRDYKKVL